MPILSKKGVPAVPRWNGLLLCTALAWQKRFKVFMRSFGLLQFMTEVQYLRPHLRSTRQCSGGKSLFSLMTREVPTNFPEPVVLRYSLQVLDRLLSAECRNRSLKFGFPLSRHILWNKPVVQKTMFFCFYWTTLFWSWSVKLLEVGAGAWNLSSGSTALAPSPRQIIIGWWQSGSCLEFGPLSSGWLSWNSTSFCSTRSW